MSYPEVLAKDLLISFLDVTDESTLPRLSGWTLSGDDSMLAVCFSAADDSRFDWATGGGSLGSW